MTSIAQTPIHEGHLGPLMDAGLEAVVLLGGTVRQTDFRRAIGRHILQLPIDEERTILSRWTEQTGALALQLRLKSIRLRILLSRDEFVSGDAPADVPYFPATSVSIETDPNPTRGTGGVLRDLVEDIPDSRWILIANANQAFIGEPLEAVRRLSAARADMALMPAADGNGGFMLLARCECFKGIAPRGFIDLKEQALPTIARRFDVRVVDPAPTLTPTSIRSLKDYLDLLKTFASPDGAAPQPPLEDWARVFQIVEKGASVAPNARIHNSVVLSGGSVESGAVVARCVVGPGGRVARDEVVRDLFVAPPSEEAGS